MRGIERRGRCCGRVEDESEGKRSFGIQSYHSLVIWAILIGAVVLLCCGEIKANHLPIRRSLRTNDSQAEFGQMSLRVGELISVHSPSPKEYILRDGRWRRGWWNSFQVTQFFPKEKCVCSIECGCRSINFWPDRHFYKIRGLSAVMELIFGRNRGELFYILYGDGSHCGSIPAVVPDHAEIPKVPIRVLHSILINCFKRNECSLNSFQRFAIDVVRFLGGYNGSSHFMQLPSGVARCKCP